MNYYISDLHIGHTNALAFDARPFKTIEENDETIKNNWNSVVGLDDDVYLLGDISWYAPYIELGYAITCHSAQGSQFDTVIGGIDFSMFIMLNKELLYTMITRASKKFILCAQTKALQYAITKEQIIHRQTYLMDDLDELCNKKFDF